MKRTERVGIAIMLASIVPAIVGLFLILFAIEWFEIGYELVRS